MLSAGAGGSPQPLSRTRTVISQIGEREATPLQLLKLPGWRRWTIISGSKVADVTQLLLQAAVAGRWLGCRDRSP